MAKKKTSKKKTAKSNAGKSVSMPSKQQVKSAAASMNQKIVYILTWALLACHAFIMVLFALTERPSPSTWNPFSLIWASQNQAQIQLVIIALVITLPVTAYGLIVPGPHRKWLIIGWVLLGGLGVYFFLDHYVFMVDVAREYG